MLIRFQNTDNVPPKQLDFARIIGVQTQLQHRVDHEIIAVLLNLTVNGKGLVHCALIPFPDAFLVGVCQCGNEFVGAVIGDPLCRNRVLVSSESIKLTP